MKPAQVNPEAWGNSHGRHIAQEHGREPTDEEMVAQWARVSGTPPYGPAFVEFCNAARERAQGEMQAAEGAAAVLSQAEAEECIAAIRYQLGLAQEPSLPMPQRLDAAANARRAANGYGWWELGREAAGVEARLRAGGDGSSSTGAGEITHLEERAGGRSR